MPYGALALAAAVRVIDGFMTLPRTVGLQPICLFLPAEPIDMFSCSIFPTWPIEAMQLRRT
jgi:hypothetical protein